MTIWLFTSLFLSRKVVMNMFDYKEFKKEMSKRGHEVHKRGDYITIEPK